MNRSARTRFLTVAPLFAVLMFSVAHLAGGGAAFWVFFVAGAAVFLLVLLALMWEVADLVRGRQ